LLLLQDRKYLITHNTGTVTTPRAITGRQKKKGKSFPTAKNKYRDVKEMKKTDTQIQTPTKCKLCQRTQ
jgi:hypothetical protein